MLEWLIFGAGVLVGLVLYAVFPEQCMYVENLVYELIEKVKSKS